MQETLVVFEEESDRSLPHGTCTQCLSVLNRICEHVDTIAKSQEWQVGLLSTPRMAALLDVTSDTLKKAAAAGEIPGHKIMGRGKRGSWYFNPEEVQHAIQSRKQQEDYSDTVDAIFSDII